MQEPQQPEQEQERPHQQPTPDPAPETQPAPNPAPAQPGTQHTAPTTPESQDKNPTAQTFTGIISKEADSYVLKVADSSFYKLDDQNQVQPFEGRRVQVTGTLDTSLNLIHVDKVEPLS
jgi:outer membrane biosynthesis protein TonB